MGDRVAGVAQPADGPLKSVEHVIEPRAHVLELIPSAAQAHAGTQITPLHGRHDRCETRDRTAHVAAEQQAPGQAEDHHQGAGAP